MSMTVTTSEIELQSYPELHSDPEPFTERSSKGQLSLPASRASSQIQVLQQNTSNLETVLDNELGSNVATAIPDGGYGWTIVFCCASMNFFFTGFSGSWGVLQTALLQSDLSSFSASTVSWVGSLNLGCVVAFGLFAVRLFPIFGARNTTLLGELLLSAGIFASGFTTRDIGGLFVTSGAMVGLGSSLVFAVTNTMPTQYFNGSLGGKLGLANGLVKLGGGIGATVLSVSLEALNRRLGTAWTFRIYGLLNLACAVPAAWFIRDRIPPRKAPIVDLSVFRNYAYTGVFIAGSIVVFALYIPPFFIPLFAQSIGLSSKTGAAIVAGFNLSTAIGRFGAGPLCDKIGTMNTLLITMALNAASMLAIWPVSSSQGPLILFAICNGVANGAFFTATPTVVASMVGPGRAAVAMSTVTSGWTFGYLLGTPIAGYLLQAAGGPNDGSIDSYRPAIFYAGGVALVSSAVVLLARLNMSKQLIRKV